MKIKEKRKIADYHQVESHIEMHKKSIHAKMQKIYIERAI
jgi:hypothetical protein